MPTKNGIMRRHLQDEAKQLLSGIQVTSETNIIVIGSAAAILCEWLEEEEIEFVRQQLPRIARINQGKALRVELYLEQGTDQ